MKTTVDISDALFRRAKRHAKKAGLPLRALVEEGLRRVLDSETKAPPYRLPDLSVGEPSDESPLDSMSWQELRDEIYAGR